MNQKTMMCGHFILNKQKLNLWPTKCFRKAIDCEFEGRKFLIPEDYDTVLKISYGDYMKLPPEEQRIPRHENIEIYRKQNNMNRY